MLDEGLRVRLLSGAAAQLALPNSQWADASGPGLDDDDQDRRDMSQPEPAIPHPAPVGGQTRQYQQESDDDETDERKVEDQNAIGEEAI